MAPAARRIVETWPCFQICGNASDTGLAFLSRIRATCGRGENAQEAETEAAADRQAD